MRGVPFTDKHLSLAKGKLNSVSSTLQEKPLLGRSLRFVLGKFKTLVPPPYSSHEALKDLTIHTFSQKPLLDDFSSLLIKGFKIRSRSDEELWRNS
jgi:hypothetical protein